MNEIEQRIAIAEACGWRDLINEGEMGRCGTMQPNVEQIATPNYLRDLNAMHEAERTLTPGRAWLFQIQLQTVVSKALKAKAETFSLVHAIAPQRAEAFLRTIGKWKE